jgi:hypothetical protein
VLPVAEQAELFWFRLDGLSVKTGGSVQLHVTFTAVSPSAPEKVKLPLEQGIAVIITGIDCPGVSWPLAGLKLTPLRVLVADQLTVPCELAVSLTVTWHCKVLPVKEQAELVWSKLVGLTANVGGGGGDVQLHEMVTGVSPSAPEKMKVPFWQGIAAIVTVCEPFGDNWPEAGLKVTPVRLLLADQLALPCELDVSPNETMHW